MRQAIFSVYWAIRSAVRAVTLLRQKDPSTYYTLMGDDVIDFLDEGYADESKPLWLNLGYWKTARTYPEACVAMAELLGARAGMSAGDRVLDAGAGFAEQDLVFLDRFNVAHITGLDITPIHVEKARARISHRSLEKRIDIRLGSATAIEAPDASFDRVVALESAFHFNTRESFWREALRVLKPRGTLALADMLPAPGKKYGLTARFCRKYSHVPEANHYDRHEYAQRLSAAGFSDVTVESIREHVYPGMAQYIWQRIGGKKKMHEVQVTVTDEDRAECRGLNLWERTSGFSDYVIATARKNGLPNGSPPVG